MKVINKRFKPNECNYKYLFKIYYYQPKGTVISYYTKDDNNNYTAVCRHKLYLREILLLLTIIVCAYHIYELGRLDIKINAPKYMVLRDDVLSLNLKSSDKCYYTLLLDNVIISEGLLEPGKSIGNIKVISKNMMEGDYPAILRFLVEDSHKNSKTQDKDVLIRVRNTSDYKMTE